MAKGSRLTCPTAPSAAAVVSEPKVAARKTPKFQLKAWYTRGTVVGRLPPKMKALIGTPAGFSALASKLGTWDSGAVKRAFGCAAGRPEVGVQSFPCQSVSFGGG